MNNCRSRNRKSQIANRKEAFTLIELLTVVAIIAILTSMVIGVSGYASRKADISKAKADMEKIKNALEEYRLAYGIYPANATPANSQNLSKALWDDPQDDDRIKKPFLVMKGWTDKDTDYPIRDPWENDYRYEHHAVNPYATHNNSRFGYDLWSLGPDGQDDTEDDLTNWKAE